MPYTGAPCSDSRWTLVDWAGLDQNNEKRFPEESGAASIGLKRFPPNSIARGGIVQEYCLSSMTKRCKSDP